MKQKIEIAGVRLTPSEKSIFQDAAERLEMSLSGLMREATLQLIHRELLQARGNYTEHEGIEHG